MQVLMTGKGMELTESIKDYVEKKISALDKFFDGIVRADVILGVENHHHQKGKIFVCECKLEVPGNDLFASKDEQNLYKAVDKVRDYLEGELKKHKVKLRGVEKKKRETKRETKEYQP